MDLKKQNRQRLSSLLDQLSEKEIHEKSQQIIHNLKDLNFLNGVWAGFKPLLKEPNLNDLWSSAVSNNELAFLPIWVFPKMQNDILLFFQATEFSKGNFGVFEPSGEVIQRPLSEVSGLLIPGLGFDQFGNRLGKGKGFYDKTLSSYRGLKVGVAFECQVQQDELPTDTFDVKMNFLVTEKEIRQF